MPIEQIPECWLEYSQFDAFALILSVTAFPPNELTNPKWKTVNDTRAHGWHNAILSFVTACYLVVYIIAKRLSLYYNAGNEMCTAPRVVPALVGLVLSLRTLFRALYRLWQLRCFRRWAMDSIAGLEAMKVPLRFKSDRTKKKATTSFSRRWAEKIGSGLEAMLTSDRAEKESATLSIIADSLLVNETIIGNQLMHGETRCYLQYGDLTLKGGEYGDPSIVRYLRCIWQSVCLATFWLFDHVKFMFGQRKERKLEMKLFKPESVWLNWSVALASQCLGQWISDFSAAKDPASEAGYYDMTDSERFEKRGQYFGLELLSSAWLHMLSEIEMAGVRSLRAPFHRYNMWNTQSRMADGMMTKRELLEKAMGSGDGLPFGLPHNIGDKKGMERPGYGAYWKELEQIVNELPVRSGFDVRIEWYDIEKPEWLTILLYLGKVASCIDVTTLPVARMQSIAHEARSDEV